MAVMGQGSGLKSGEKQELYIQSTLYQGDASETSTFHKQTVPPGREQQRPAAPHENMVSKAGATPTNAQSHSTQQSDQGKQMAAKFSQESRSSGKCMVMRQGQGQAKKANLQVRSSDSNQGQT